MKDSPSRDEGLDLIRQQRTTIRGLRARERGVGCKENRSKVLAINQVRN